MIRQTRHFLQRAAQRGLRPEVLEFVLVWGREVSRAGARFVTVHTRDLPSGIDHHAAERARGWVVVFDQQDVLRTCYRRSDPVRYVQHKLPYDNPPARRAA